MPVFNASDFDSTDSADPGAGDIQGLIRQQATSQGLNPDTLARMGKQESGFKANAVSPKGAIGPMQLMPKTAAGLGVDPNNPRENVEGGVRYFGQLLNMFGGDEKKAAAAYNAGPGRMRDVLAGKKQIPGETSDYLKSIFGKTGLPTWATLSPSAALAGPPATGRVFDAGEFGGPPDYSFANNVTSLPRELANTLAGNLDIAGGMAGAKLGADFGPWGAAGLGVVGALAGRRFTQAYQEFLDPENAPKTPQEAREQMFESGKNAVLGEVQGAAMRRAFPWAQQKLYAKLTGADMNKVADQEAVSALTRDKIPLGIGQDRAITKWKAPDLETIDKIVDKYKPSQVPGLVRTGVAGQKSAQQGASMWTGGINKTKLEDDLRTYYASNPEIPQDEKKAFIDQFNNFFKDMPENISLTSARNVKQRIDLKIPFNEQTEGKLAARKALRYFTNQAMAESIPDITDRNAFVQAASNLETKINAEQLADRLRKRGAGYATNPKIAGVIALSAAGAGGLYGHSVPAALGAAGLATMLTGPTATSRTVNLLNSPFIQHAMEVPTRAAPGQMQQDLGAASQVGGVGLDQLQQLLESARSIKFPGGQ